jgi:MFS family permease
MKLSTDITLESGLIPKASFNYLPWLVCFASSLFFFYEFIQMNMFNAINTQLMQEYHLTAGALGKMSACYFYANVLFLLPAGSILDRFSTKKVVLIALTICATGTFLFACAHSLLLASIFRFLTGIGSAFCFLSCIRLASRWFPAERMALVSGLIVTMAMIGGMIAQAPLTLLVNTIGWRSAVECDALLGLFIALFIFAVVQDYPKNVATTYQQERLELQQFGFWRGLRQGFLSLQNWLCGIYTSLLNLPLFLLGGLWGSMFLATAHHLSHTKATYVTSMVFLGTIIGSPMMGWLSDKVGKRKLPMIIGAIFSFIVVMIILLSINLSFWTLILLFFLLGFVTSTQVISYPTVTESNKRLFTATCVSVVSLCAISGGAIFEPFFGWLMDYHWNGVMVDGLRHYSVNDFQFALRLFPIGVLIALGASFLVKETHCKPSYQE